MKTRNKKSIFIKTLMYLIFFCLIILVFLILFETLYFKVYYIYNQKKNATSVVNKINELSIDDNNVKDIEKLVYNSNLCAIIYKDYGDVIEYNTKMRECDIHNPEVMKEVYTFINSKNDSINKKIEIGEFQGFLYGVKNNEYDILVYVPLHNMFLTSLLNNQIIYISIGVIILSIVITIYISNLIAKPLKKINEFARNIGNEKYKNTYKETGIIEIDELNETLDAVQIELGKIGEYQNDLLANVTHDLKTPLTMIKAYAEKIKDISYKDKEKLDKDVNVIIDETERLTSLVNDILEGSKELNNDNLKKEDYDLIEEINNIMKRYDIIKEKEKYKFELDLLPMAYVNADKNKINQIIYNLINNAINYTGDDKKVTIRVSKKAKRYLVEIIDTGKGINKNDINNIWTKYYKNDKNHKRNVVSTGLGLSIVKDILEKHKCEYGVKSIEGKGTTFYFYISSSNFHKKNTKKN